MWLTGRGPSDTLKKLRTLRTPDTHTRDFAPHRNEQLTGPAARTPARVKPRRAAGSGAPAGSATTPHTRTRSTPHDTLGPVAFRTTALLRWPPAVSPGLGFILPPKIPTDREHEQPGDDTQDHEKTDEAEGDRIAFGQPVEKLCNRRTPVPAHRLPHSRSRRCVRTPSPMNTRPPSQKRPAAVHFPPT